VIGLYEGYYVELFDGSIWAVKGCCHEDGRVVAMPRVVDGRKYKGYEDQMNLVKRLYSRYLARPSFTTREIPMIPGRDVKRIIRPSSNVLCVDREDLVTVANEIIEILDRNAGGEWMITGSLLYCMPSWESDIDVISYRADRRNIDRVIDLIDRGILRRPSVAEAVGEALENPEGIGLRLRVLGLLRGVQSIYYKGARVTLQVVRCDRRVLSTICCDKTYSSSYSAVIEIIELLSDFSSPYIYYANLVRVYEGDLKDGNEILAYSHRARYASLARGSRLVCRGLIEFGSDGSRYLNLDLSYCFLWE